MTARIDSLLQRLMIASKVEKGETIHFEHPKHLMSVARSRLLEAVALLRMAFKTAGPKEAEQIQNWLKEVEDGFEG